MYNSSDASIGSSVNEKESNPKMDTLPSPATIPMVTPRQGPELDPNIVVNYNVALDDSTSKFTISGINSHYAKYYGSGQLEVDANYVPIFSWNTDMYFSKALRLAKTGMIETKNYLLNTSIMGDSNTKEAASQQLKSCRFGGVYIYALLRSCLLKSGQEYYAKEEDENGVKYLSRRTKKSIIEEYKEFPPDLQTAMKLMRNEFSVSETFASTFTNITFAPSLPSSWTKKDKTGFIHNNANLYPGRKYTGVPSKTGRLPGDQSNWHYMYRHAKDTSNIARYIFEVMTSETEEISKFFFGYHRLALAGVRVPIIMICVGEQGNGKTLINIDLARVILGERYVTPSSTTKNVTGQFDSIIVNKVLVAFDDTIPMSQEEQTAFYQKCKAISTNKTVTTTMKFQDTANTTVTCNLVICGNTIYCYFIEKGCRRTFCFPFNHHRGGWTLSDIKHPDRLPSSVKSRLENAEAGTKDSLMTGLEVTQYIGELINGNSNSDQPCDDAIQSYLNYINTEGIYCDDIRYKSAPPMTTLKRDMRLRQMTTIEEFVYTFILVGCQYPTTGDIDIGWDKVNECMLVKPRVPYTSKQLYDLYYAWFSFRAGLAHDGDYTKLKERGLQPLQSAGFAKALTTFSKHINATTTSMSPGFLYTIPPINKTGNKTHKPHVYFVVEGEVGALAVDLGLQDVEMDFNPACNEHDAEFERDLDRILEYTVRSGFDVEPGVKDLEVKLPETKEEKIAKLRRELEILESSMNN